MFRKISDFTRTWDRETESTLKILRAMSDASLAQKVSPEGRSLGTLAWHCVTVLPEMMKHAGVPVVGPSYDAPVPARVADIACEYEKCARAITVGLTWTDDMLGELIPMFGEKWPRGAVLFALVAHQSHHRGQMTVLMRQAGLTVPGVAGPAREEWAAMNMPAQA